MGNFKHVISVLNLFLVQDVLINKNGDNHCCQNGQ